MSPLRKTALLAAAALAALVLAGPASGPLLRLVLSKAGERAFGAAVDIGSVRLDVFTGSLELRSVSAADKRRPLRNLFRFDKAVFRLSPGGLLRGRIEAGQADVSGLTVGGPRAGTGARPALPGSPFERAVDGQLDTGAAQAERALDRAGARLSQVSDRFAPARALDEEVRGALAAAPRTPGADALASKAELARRAAQRARAQTGLARACERVEQARRQLDEQFEAAGHDLARARDALLPAGRARSLDRRLLGRAAAHSVVTALSLVRLARAAETSRLRPYLVIDTMRLTGRIEGAFGGRPMDLEGMVLGLSSNARAYGKPTRLIFKGESADGSSVLGMQGIVDDGLEPPRTDLAFHCAGMSLAGDGLGDPAVGASIERGVARVNGALHIEGRTWSGRFSLTASGVRLSPRTTLTGPAGERVRAALSRLSRFDADVAVEGDEDDLTVDLTSDLGPALERALAGARLEEDRRRAAALARLGALRRQEARLRASLSAPLKRDLALLNAAAQSSRQSLEVSFPAP